MLWYGSNVRFKKLKKNYLNSSISFYKKKKLNSLFLRKRNLYQIFPFYLYLPSMWKYSIFKITNKNTYVLYLYSINYFFFIPINNSLLHTSPFLNSSTISFFYIVKSTFFNTFFSFFKKIFYVFSKIFFKKIKFKGKGYYVYKNKRNTIAFRFGYSHIKRMYFFFTYVKFLSKTSIIVFGLNYKLLTETIKNIKSVRPINLFTAKGIRFTRQILYRKTGKVSSYR